MIWYDIILYYIMSCYIILYYIIYIYILLISLLCHIYILLIPLLDTLNILSYVYIYITYIIIRYIKYTLLYIYIYITYIIIIYIYMIYTLLYNIYILYSIIYNYICNVHSWPLWLYHDFPGDLCLPGSRCSVSFPRLKLCEIKAVDKLLSPSGELRGRGGGEAWKNQRSLGCSLWRNPEKDRKKPWDYGSMGVAYVSVSPYSIIQNYSLSTVNWDDRSNHKWTTIGSNRKYGNPKVKDLFWGGALNQTAWNYWPITLSEKDMEGCWI